MKLTAPLKTPAKNTEQKIFKLILFGVLPLLAVLTIYSYSRIKINKTEAAKSRISVLNENVNKRLTIFMDPLSRDIAYLQVRAQKGRLGPETASDTRDFFTSFSEFYLQNTCEVVFWDGTTASVFSITPDSCTGPHNVADQTFYETLFKKTLEDSTPDSVSWNPSYKDPFLFETAIFTNPKTKALNIIALHIDATEFFARLEKYTTDRLFLVSDRPGRLPSQFILKEDQNPDVIETNDPVILTAFSEWKKNSDIETFPLPYEGRTWWASIHPLEIKDRKLYSGLILPESELIAEALQEQRLVAAISLISFVIMLIAAIFLWRRYQHDLQQSSLPPAVNKMTDEQILQTIARGEGDRLEFKSTLRWNLHTNKPDKAMEIACLKTIAAFLNSDGGTLLVGVQDDGSILGIAADQFPNEDKFLLHFNNLINQHLGLENTDSFSFDIRHLEAGDILIVDCLPSPAPVYVTHDTKEEFYVRVGPGTRPLTTRDALEYIRNHF